MVRRPVAQRLHELGSSNGAKDRNILERDALGPVGASLALADGAGIQEQHVAHLVRGGNGGLGAGRTGADDGDVVDVQRSEERGGSLP